MHSQTNLISKAASSLAAKSIDSISQSTIISGGAEKGNINHSLSHLTESEQQLLFSIVQQSKISRRLFIIDFLFFDLYNSIKSLKNFVEKEVCNNALKNLSIYYTSMLDIEMMPLREFNDFLQNLALSFIKSNHERMKQAVMTPAERKIFMPKISMQIISTLRDRANIFIKFLTTPTIFPLFFSIANDVYDNQIKLTPENAFDYIEIIKENIFFTKITLRVSCEMHPDLTAHQSTINCITENIQRMMAHEITQSIFKSLLEEAWLASEALKEKYSHVYRIVRSVLLGCDIVYGIYLRLVNLQMTQRGQQALLSGHSIMEGSNEHLYPGDILGNFKIDHLVSLNLTLNESEIKTLRELFSNYPLDSNITLIDLLSFAFYDRLGKLSSRLPKRVQDKLRDTQRKIVAYFMLLYRGLGRATPDTVKLLGPVSDYSNAHGYSPTKFLSLLNAAILELTTQVTAASTGIFFSEKIDRARLKSTQGYCNAIDEVVKPLMVIITKFIGDKGCYSLMLRSISMFREHSQIDIESSQGAAMVKAYLECIRAGYDYITQHKLSSICANFNAIAAAFPSLSSPTTAEMTRFGIGMTSYIEAFRQQKLASNAELRLHLAGKLSFLQWIAKHKIVMVREKPALDFIEQLYAMEQSSALTMAIATDILRLVEKRIYPKERITTSACFYRLYHNVTFNRNNTLAEFSFELPKEIKEKFSNAFSLLVEYINSDMFSYINRFCLDDRDTLAGAFAYEKWIELLLPQKNNLELILCNTLKAISSIPKECLQIFKNNWSQLSLQELSQIKSAEIKEAFFNEGLRYLRPLLIVVDILALLQVRHFMEEAAIIPSELADIMDLDGIDKIREILIEEKTAEQVKQVEQAIVTQEIESLIEATEIQNALDVPARTKAFIKTNTAKEKPVSPKIQTYESAVPLDQAIKEIAYLNKARKIMTRLKQMGFVQDRQTGSHRIMKNEAGATVVIPNNDSLPIGTSRSIAAQVARATQPEPSSLVARPGF